MSVLYGHIVLRVFIYKLFAVFRLVCCASCFVWLVNEIVCLCPSMYYM